MASRKRNTEIKKVEDHQARKVCFSKRRQGLFKIAEKYHQQSQSEVAVIVISSAGKHYAAGSPSFDPIVHKFLQTHSSDPDDSDSSTITDSSGSGSGSVSASSSVIDEETALRWREWVDLVKVEESENLEELKYLKKTLQELKEKPTHGIVGSSVMGTSSLIVPS